jgi:uncharacterized protein YcbK (DUF882 family)
MAKNANRYWWLLSIPAILLIAKKFKVMNTTNKKQLTKNFAKSEFESHDGAVMPDDVQKNIIELAVNLQTLRDKVNATIKINSGYRSPAWNKKVGGVQDSQHVLGKAADIVVQGFTPIQIAQTIEALIAAGKMKQGGIGIYPNFVHYDVRGTKARWRA